MSNKPSFSKLQTKAVSGAQFYKPPPRRVHLSKFWIESWIDPGKVSVEPTETGRHCFFERPEAGGRVADLYSGPKECIQRKTYRYHTSRIFH